MEALFAFPRRIKRRILRIQIPFYVSLLVNLGLILGFISLSYLAVPNEQSFPMNYPNVLFIGNTGDIELTPKSYTGEPVPEYPSSTVNISGVYQHDLFFYHSRMSTFMSKFVSEGGNYRAWECVYGGKPSVPGAKLYLIHKIPSEGGSKEFNHNVWFIAEMHDRESTQGAITPLVYARSKRKKKLHIVDAEFVEGDPEPRKDKPKQIPIYITHIWHILEPTTILCILGWISSIGTIVGFWWLSCRDGDDDYDYGQETKRA